MGIFSSGKKSRKPPTDGTAPSLAKSPSARESSDDDKKHVAVVGSGIAGLSAAYLAHRNGYKVTLFEQGDMCGGHALTVDSSVGPVDLGFQVRDLDRRFSAKTRTPPNATFSVSQRRAPSVKTISADSADDDPGSLPPPFLPSRGNPPSRVSRVTLRTPRCST
jgi:monoamine oxidase